MPRGSTCFLRTMAGDGVCRLIGVSKPHDRTHCMLNKSFGCESDKMWVRDGCHGAFTCGDQDSSTPVFCGSNSVAEQTCACTPLLTAAGRCVPHLHVSKGETMLVGVFGNSIAAGVDVARKATWPSQLQTFFEAGRKVRVLNRAVRASRADFAGLCFDELIPRTTRLSVAVVDYSFTSSPAQILALVDRLQSMGVPTIVLLYCAHNGWHRHVHCGLDTRGYCAANVDANQTRPKHARRGGDEWATLTAPPIQRAGERIAGRGMRHGLGSSFGKAAAAIGELISRPLAGCRTHLLECIGVPLSPAANATFERLRRQGFDKRLMQLAQHRFYATGLRAAADPAVFAGVEGATAAAVAASFVRGQLSHGTTRAAAALRQAVSQGVGGEASTWLDALSAVAAGECLSSSANVDLIAKLEARGVPYVSNVAQLSLLAEEVLARKGAWGAHPNQYGHQLMALAVDGMLRTMMRPARAAGRACMGGAVSSALTNAEAKAYPEQMCSYGQQAVASLALWRSGFESVDAGGEGRTGGLAAKTAGASCALRLASNSLSAGWLNLGYERGWRHVAVARVKCVPPCACVGLTINATNPKPYTGTAFTMPMWITLARALPTDAYTCVVQVDTTVLAAGRLLLQAATLSAPLPGNNSVALKDSLQMADELKQFDPFVPF